jgi:hypothetical protein
MAVWEGGAPQRHGLWFPHPDLLLLTSCRVRKLVEDRSFLSDASPAPVTRHQACHDLRATRVGLVLFFDVWFVYRAQ